ECKPARIDEAACLVSKGNVHGDDVGACEQLVEIGRPPHHAGVVTSMVDHMHAKARRAAGHSSADASEPHDAEYCAVHVHAVVRVEPPSLPTTAPKIRFGLGR